MHVSCLLPHLHSLFHLFPVWSIAGMWGCEHQVGLETPGAPPLFPFPTSCSLFPRYLALLRASLRLCSLDALSACASRTSDDPSPPLGGFDDGSDAQPVSHGAPSPPLGGFDDGSDAQPVSHGVRCPVPVPVPAGPGPRAFNACSCRRKSHIAQSCESNRNTINSHRKRAPCPYGRAGARA